MLEQILALLEEKRFAAIRELLVEENPADIAEAASEISEEKLLVLFRLLPKSIASDVFVEMQSEQQETLIKSFSDSELRRVIDDLYVDDTVDIIEEMPASVVKRILKNTDADTRNAINQILQYPKDSAGSIMTIEYVDLKKHITVDRAFDHIKKTGVEKETIYTSYVTDNERHLIGLVTAKDLLLANRDDIIEDIMEKNVISVNTLDDKEDVAKMFEKYDFLALPVVDKEGRLVGIVTVDDAIDVMSEEAEEDFAIMAGITPQEKPYLHSSAFSIFLSRIPWLLLLMISATFTGMIISGFESALSVYVVLTTFIPMLMGTAGNSSSQSSVTVIRGLSMGEIDFSDTLRVQWKELRISIGCGITLAIANFLKLYYFDRLLLGNSDITVTVAMVVSLTLIVTVILAKLVGCTLPILAKRIGFDPAVMASPFITTIVDALSLVVFFSIAVSFLPI